MKNMVQIILYEDENFGGRVLELSAPASKLSQHGFNDIISSIKVENGEYVLIVFLSYRNV